MVVSLGVLGFTAPMPTGDRTLHPGDYTKVVERLQRRLQKLKFSPGLVNGYYGAETQVAVWAFQKSQGFVPQDEVGPDTWRALAHPRVPPPLVPEGQARRVEIDLRSRLLTVYRGYRPMLVSHVATGAGTAFCQYGHTSVTTTPAGDFRVVKRARRPTANPLVTTYETFSFRSDPWAALGLGAGSLLQGGVVGGMTGGETTIGLAGDAVRLAPTARPLPSARSTPMTGPAPAAGPVPVAGPVSGCVRVPAHLAERLFRLVRVGDPVNIRHGR
ncbi:L,D-transpeptidase family protein [Streptosporangium sp. NPDC004631]